MSREAMAPDVRGVARGHRYDLVCTSASRNAPALESALKKARPRDLSRRRADTASQLIGELRKRSDVCSRYTAQDILFSVAKPLLLNVPLRVERPQDEVCPR
jgi:hypothetical protein